MSKNNIRIVKLERDLEYARKMVDITADYWGSLTVKKDKYFGEKDVLSDHLIVADVKEMSREELEKFADRMRIDRNSFLYRSEDEWKKLEDRIIELATELYFSNRNKRIGEIVDSGNNICFEKHECNYVHKCISSINKEIEDIVESS